MRLRIHWMTPNALRTSTAWAGTFIWGADSRYDAMYDWRPCDRWDEVMHLRRMVLLLGVVSTLFVGAASASSAVSLRSPSLTFFFTQPGPQQRTHIGVKVCVANAARGWLVRLQEARRWGHVWRTVEHYRSPLATSCVEVGMSSGAIGLKPFRAQLLDGRTLRRQTPVKNLRVYGVIPGACSSVSRTVRT